MTPQRRAGLRKRPKSSLSALCSFVNAEYPAALMATTERPDLMPAGAAGYPSARVGEITPELAAYGGVQVRARGYWEQVWIRFRRDRVAIIGGIFIIGLVLAAFVGAPIMSAILGHGPDDIFPVGGIDQTTLLPVGPWTHVSKAPYA